MTKTPMKIKKLEFDDFGYWFVTANQKLWLPKGDLPFGRADALRLTHESAQKIGTFNGETAWLIRKNQSADMSTFRHFLNETPLFLLCAKAIQIDAFYRSHLYCGYCQQIMMPSETEWCVLCDACGHRYYPQIAPAIIVAIRQHDKILLAKHQRHEKENLYTILAGFSEVGETIETTVKREVFEETGIQIKNIRYVSSQIWPYPHSMMFGFLADYDSGALQLDKNELADAKWFSYLDLPKIPEYGTIARRLIEDTIVLCREADHSNS